MPSQKLPCAFISFISRGCLLNSPASFLSFTSDSVLFARRAFLSILLLFVLHVPQGYLFKTLEIVLCLLCFCMFSGASQAFRIAYAFTMQSLPYFIYISYCWRTASSPRPDCKSEVPRPSRSLDPRASSTLLVPWPLEIP